MAGSILFLSWNASLPVAKPFQLDNHARIINSEQMPLAQVLSCPILSIPMAIFQRARYIYSILIFFASFATAFGTTTVKIPSFKLAFTPSWSTLPGKVKLR